MTTRQWLCIVAWHIVRSVEVDRDDVLRVTTYCNSRSPRSVTASQLVVDTLPAGKTCEVCYRVEGTKR